MVPRTGVTFAGPVAGGAKQELFESADLFVLPSHSESFGMVVAEALSYGLPVVTTTATPWSELVEHGCGWRVPATAQAIAEALSLATSCDRRALQRMGEKGRALISSRYDWSSVAQSFLSLYADALRST